MPILLVVSSPLAIRAFISVLDNKQLLCSTSGPPSGWQTSLEALVDDLVSSIHVASNWRNIFFGPTDSPSIIGHI